MTLQIKPFEELSRSGKFYREHPEYSREYRRKNLEYFRERSEEWRRDHPEYNKKYFREHPEYITNWRREHPESSRNYLEKLRKYYKVIKILVLRHYSSGRMSCANCGERNTNFLTIDHVNGGGRRHLKEIKRGSIIKWLFMQHSKTGKWPKGFQVLCLNCNRKKSFAENNYGAASSPSSKYYTKLIAEIHAQLGGKCRICGFSDKRALDIDHINGGGSQQRKSNRSSYYESILDEIESGSNDYQLLCANHNLEKLIEKRC